MAQEPRISTFVGWESPFSPLYGLRKIFSSIHLSISVRLSRIKQHWIFPRSYVRLTWAFLIIILYHWRDKRDPDHDFAFEGKPILILQYTYMVGDDAATTERIPTNVTSLQNYLPISSNKCKIKSYPRLCVGMKIPPKTPESASYALV
jgi:hypothetical protein